MNKDIGMLLHKLDEVLDALDKLSNEDGEIMEYDINPMENEIIEFYNFIINKDDE